MRTAIACERCRTSKVKCHHTGNAPCRGCAKSGNADKCVLTPTVVATPLHSQSGPAGQKRSGQVDATNSKRRVRRTKPLGLDVLETASVEEHFAGVDASIFTQAVAVFRLQFPEMGFLHPSDLEPVSIDLPEDDKLRLISILAVSCRYLGEAVDARRAEHAALLTKELSWRITAPPTLSLVQCFLVMALYEWGEGIGYSAWMYAGIAARMAQVYRATKTETSRPDQRLTNQPVLSEAEVRTMWTYFAIDKLLSCGKQRPAMIKLKDMEVRMPQNEEDFVFGIEPREALTFDDIAGDQPLRRRTSTPGYHFSVLVRGLDIWHKTHSWIVEGGRKLPKMTDLPNSPWRSTSDWAKMKEQLHKWRDDQDPRLRYPETKVATHVHFRQGEVFAYINLLYYLNLTFFNREFIPLLPIGEQYPRGPIDLPLFNEAAPEGWWLQNADELFESAAQMSYIMRDLNSLDISLHTPFTGLCVFTAAMLNLYLVAFPYMHRPEETALRRQLAEENLSDLEKIAKLWKLGEEWVQVVGAAENLYERVKNNQLTSRSRDDYPELENSVHYAPIGGLYGDKVSPREKRIVVSPTIPTRPQRRRRQDNDVPNVGTENPPNQQEDYTMSTPFAGFDADITSADWRLWSFWDDPHLLSWDPSTMGI